MKHPIVGIENVNKEFRAGKDSYASQVLKDVSLEVHDRDFMVVFGPSGSGKSTLLNLMAGLEDPSSGRVLVRGRDLANYEPASLARYHRIRTGMVFQSFNLLKSLNCWENVALPMTAEGVRYATRRRKALKLMEQFGLGAYADRRPTELSGGEQQRLAIARAMVNNPSLFLIDEPTGNLDTKTAADVMDIFAEIHRERNVAMVMVTHNPAHLAYATRIVHIVDGQITKEETK